MTATSTEAPCVYFVRFWLDPARANEVLAWLDGGHIAEVVSQPGMLWAKRYRLEQDGTDGWHAYVMIYGLESRQALDDYFANPIHEKFRRENARFQAVLRAERLWGSLDFEHVKATPRNN